jgi:hypothetical protein
MNKLKPMLLIFVCLFMRHLSMAQTITQEAFLKQLVETHPIFEKEMLSAEILREDQKSLAGMQDWTMFSSIGYSHEEPDIAIAGPERTDAFSVSGGVEKLFWKTGGRLSASVTASYAKIKIDPLWGFPNTFYQNRIDLSYRHPLLKNKKGFLDRLEYDLKQYDIDFSEVQAKENLEDFVAASASKYLDWVYLTEQIKILQDRLKLSQDELDRTVRKREANLVDQADVIRAEDAVRIWNQNLVLVESQMKALQAELAVLVQNPELNQSVPDYNLYRIEALIPLEESALRLKENSRLIKPFDILISQLEFANRGFKETGKPDLAFLAQANLKKLDEGLGQSLGLDKPDAMLGLEYRFPVGNRIAKHQMVKTDLQISQARRQREEIVLTLTSSLTNLYIQLTELVHVLQLNQEQIDSAKERTQEELKLYNQGRGDLTFVILSRDNEDNAKLTYLLNALTYHKLLIEYKSLLDQLY